ncbi:MAG: hypothetical protein ABIH36_04500 [bacterium]
MANMEGIKIHTMHDDLASARSPVNTSVTKNTPLKPSSQPKSFPVPARLVLPRRNPAMMGRRRTIHWFIIGAAILIILNIIIWGIAIVG